MSTPMVSNKKTLFQEIAQTFEGKHQSMEKSIRKFAKSNSLKSSLRIDMSEKSQTIYEDHDE